MSATMGEQPPLAYEDGEPGMRALSSPEWSGHSSLDARVWMCRRQLLWVELQVCLPVTTSQCTLPCALPPTQPWPRSCWAGSRGSSSHGSTRRLAPPAAPQALPVPAWPRPCPERQRTVQVGWSCTAAVPVAPPFASRGTTTRSSCWRLGAGGVASGPTRSRSAAGALRCRGPFLGANAAESALWCYPPSSPSTEGLGSWLAAHLLRSCPPPPTSPACLRGSGTAALQGCGPGCPPRRRPGGPHLDGDVVRGAAAVVRAGCSGGRQRSSAAPCLLAVEHKARQA